MPSFLRSFGLFFITLPILIACCCCLASPLTRSEIEEFFGLGRYICNLPVNESVYRIAILVPFDPSLADISSTPPQIKVLPPMDFLGFG